MLAIDLPFRSNRPANPYHAITARLGASNPAATTAAREIAAGRNAHQTTAKPTQLNIALYFTCAATPISSPAASSPARPRASSRRHSPARFSGTVSEMVTPSAEDGPVLVTTIV